MHLFDAEAGVDSHFEKNMFLSYMPFCSHCMTDSSYDLCLSCPTNINNMMRSDVALIAHRWKSQEGGMMSTVASFPSVRNQGLIDQ
jgi:hypothetical protein